MYFQCHLYRIYIVIVFKSIFTRKSGWQVRFLQGKKKYYLTRPSLYLQVVKVQQWCKRAANQVWYILGPSNIAEQHNSNCALLMVNFCHLQFLWALHVHLEQCKCIYVKERNLELQKFKSLCGLDRREANGIPEGGLNHIREWVWVINNTVSHPLSLLFS